MKPGFYNEDGLVTTFDEAAEIGFDIERDYNNLAVLKSTASARAICENLDIKKIIIPEGVTRIGKCALSHCMGVEEIVFPKSLKQIDEKALMYCEKLNEAILPDDVEEISAFAFSHCFELKKVEFNKKILSIGNGAFENCSSLVSVIFPPIDRINCYMFTDCVNLKYVTIQEGTKYIEKGVFTGTNLNILVLPSSVEHIGEEAFFESTLERISLPSGLKRIYPKAFGGCNNLKEVIIPNTVDVLSYTAFEHCYSLDKIKISRPTLDKNPNFGEVYKDLIILESLDDYISTGKTFRQANDYFLNNENILQGENK